MRRSYWITFALVTALLIGVLLWAGSPNMNAQEREGQSPAHSSYLPIMHNPLAAQPVSRLPDGEVAVDTLSVGVDSSNDLSQVQAETLLAHSLYLPAVLTALDTEATDEVLISTAATTDITPALTVNAGFLRTQGRQIVDGSGRAVKLRGINMDTYYYYDAATWPDAQLNWYANQSDIQYLDKLGVTVIRLALHWKYFDSDLGYRLIDQYLAWCEAAGIYVILDMHVVPPDDDFGQERIWHNAAAQQQFVTLWSAIAQRYRDRTSVAGYDIYNEPRPPDPAQWWALANRVADAIRTVDPNHIVIVETPTWPEVVFALIDDTNVVYSYHDYDPFIVTHAGMDWGHDAPVPSAYAYPGRVLTGLKWLGSAGDAAHLSNQANEWRYVESSAIRPPAGAEWVGVKTYAWGNAGAVWFDDLGIRKNGAPMPMRNAGMEEVAPFDATRPRYWRFHGAGNFTGAWSNVARTGSRSLQITGSTNDYGIWLQNYEFFTAPLLPVKARDTFQVHGWVRTPENQGGAGVTLDYWQGTYVTYDRKRLQGYMQPALDWAARNNVPLYVGEFGATPNAPGKSRATLLGDKISLMNAADVHWSLWTFRMSAATPPTFGLYHGNKLDKTLATVLSKGVRQ